MRNLIKQLVGPTNVSLTSYPTLGMVASIIAAVACSSPSWAYNNEGGALACPQASVEKSGDSPPRSALVWAEEFDGPLDLTTSDHIGRWRPNDYWQDIKVGYRDFGGNSWNINPNQHSLYSPFLVADGVLTIAAKKTPQEIVSDIEAVVGPGKAPKWSGGILITDKLQRSFKYGYFEIRARWPNPGKGMFPAIWLYVADGRGDSVKSGAEIDILEIFGHSTGRPWDITVHRRDWLGAGDQTEVSSLDSDTSNWHTYGLDWQPTYLRFYRDGILVNEVTGKDASWFDVDMALRLNFTVDGSHLSKLGHVSDETTPNVMKMQVDYVRVCDNFGPCPPTNVTPCPPTNLRLD